MLLRCESLETLMSQMGHQLPLGARPPSGPVCPEQRTLFQAVETTESCHLRTDVVQRLLIQSPRPRGRAV
jgi:hypothetical protein